MIWTTSGNWYDWDSKAWRTSYPNNHHHLDRVRVLGELIDCKHSSSIQRGRLLCPGGDRQRRLCPLPVSFFASAEVPLRAVATAAAVAALSGPVRRLKSPTATFQSELFFTHTELVTFDEEGLSPLNYGTLMPLRPSGLSDNSWISATYTVLTRDSAQCPCLAWLSVKLHC